MGLFDQIAGAAAGAVGGGDRKLLPQVLEWVNSPAVGGIPGLLEKLKAGGLGDAVSSWVGSGQNLPVSASALQGALGNALMGALGAKLGLDAGGAAGKLADLLPGVVDQLSPDGQLPSGDLAGAAMNLLKGKLLG